MRLLRPSHSHFVFAVLQSGLTTAVATGIATATVSGGAGDFLRRWLAAWALSWLAMLPLVLLAAPALRRLAHALTSE